MGRHFILTGAPGAGKTVLIRQLEQDGHAVVEEAATDVIALQQAQGIAEPWRSPGFIGDIVSLQLRRQATATASGSGLHFHDRSLFCTRALALHLGHPVPPELDVAIGRVLAEGRFQRQVFLVRLLGFITRTEARRIGIEEAITFERLHENTYRSFGFEVVPIAPGSIGERAGALGAVARAATDERRSGPGN